MRYLAIAFCTFLFSNSISGQTGNISGKVSDSTGKKFLALTTITIFKARDTSIVTYRLSNDAGEFKIPGLPLNVPLRLMATYSGYEAFRQDFILKEDVSNIDFGTLRLTRTSKQLDEVIVYSERPPVVIKKDTIEFNASAFKTLPTALLEDLLKKLPGVYVDENGNILVNGQKVNRLLVDGKRFFGDDPKMATRNLPSNLIDKVQVVDDDEQIALNNDGDLSRIGKVVNITLKKGVKKALFGRVFAGGGTDNRYEIGGIINTFRDTLQMSVLGFSNNINRSSFSIKDVTQLGGFERSGWGNINGNSNTSGQQGFSMDGFSFGGTGAGVNQASGTGFNLNHSPNKKTNFYLQYLFGKTNNIVDQTQNTERYFEDTTVYTYTTTKPVSDGFTHNFGAGGSLRTDSLTIINARFSYSNAGIGSESPSSILTENNKVGLLNQGTGTLYADSKSQSYNQTISLTHRFRNKSGRNLSIFHNFLHSVNPYSNTTESFNHYQYPVVYNNIFQQLRTTNAPITTFYINSNYSDRISNKITFRFNDQISYNKNVQEVITYGKHTPGGDYDSMVVSLSNNLAREQTRWGNNAIVGYTIKKITFSAGANWLQQWINNNFGFSVQGNKQYYSNLLFNFSANWKRFNLGVSQDIIAPAINYLIPVPDNSNPFNVLVGNPLLQPTKRTVFNFNGNIFNPKTNTSYFFSAQSAISKDAIIQSVVLHGNGVQVNTPVNVDGTSYNFANIGFNRQFKNKQRFNLTVNVNLTTNLNHVPILFNNEKSYVTSANLGLSSGLLFNWHDVVEFGPKYTPAITKSYYTSSAFANRDITYQTLQGELIVRVPKKLVWETNIQYRQINEVTPGIPQSTTYWNAAVTYVMFKEDKGQLRFAVYDILNNNVNINRSFNGNSITDTRTNALNRYFLITYSYNIRTFGNQKAKVGGQGQSSMFRL
jgi:hypothetical protein